MSNKENWLSKIHFKDSVIICITVLSLILFSSKSANAVVVTYDITYDAGTGVTTLYNDASSLAPLEFRTLVGSNAMQSLYLAAGNTVSIDSGGSILGASSNIGDAFINKNAGGGGDGNVHVPPGFKGKVWVDGVAYSYDGTQTKMDDIPVTKDQEVKVQDLNDGEKIPVEWPRDAVITSNTSEVTTIYNSSTWLIPDQYNVELLSGGLHSVDDTAQFTTIFTANVATGCPEPSTCLLLGIGALGIACQNRRKVADIA